MFNKILGVLLIVFPTLIVIGVVKDYTSITGISVIGLFISNFIAGLQLLKLSKNSKSTPGR